MAEPTYWVVAPGGCLRPADRDTVAFISKYKIGDVLKARVTKSINDRFRAKWWKMAEYGFDHWQPEPFKVRGEYPEKSFELFRKDLIVLSGFYHTWYSLNKASFRVEADSIAWAKMDDVTFGELYNNSFNVIHKHILTNYTRDDLLAVLDTLNYGYG